MRSGASGVACLGASFAVSVMRTRECRLYSALSIIAPSVNVLRRTRRNPSTIKGAAPDVVIGQSTAPRAGARPYQDFAPSVNVLRRTRRNPSTIKGAAPDVVIGQSTAPRAGARPYQDFAPSVNVLRRTRRNPSTIKGAAPVVVIGQSTAPRAGARPYQDFAPPCERAAPDAPEPIDDQRRRTGCRYRTIYGASRGSASLPRLCAFCERAAPDAPEPSKAGQNLGEVNGFEFFFLSREQTLQMDQTTRIDRDQKISIGFQC